ncbi:hypothetical protein ACHAW5_007652 [Stephanodiscus triporus]|uniref:Lon N-terminal domain-containing protein n=1 Tax=Stephanodiscus triporus TaxID=2934178 RepID=A0ABD3NMZ1_9STRA
MKLLLSTASLLYRCEAFLPPAPSFVSTTRLHGINEWRDQALESRYTLDSYKQSATSSSPVPPSATIPILPFPFSDVLLQGQRTQLNLYERRFHELFRDAMDNHCGMVAMGLIAGNGMITTLPLCEVESFTRFGADEDWVDTGNGMGNGSIFVTIRAVGRAKIAESDLLQEGPYMKARVVELVDEDVSWGGGSGLKERGNGKLNGESSPLEVASLVAGNIENLLVSLASMEHAFKAAEEKKNNEKRKSSNGREAKVNDNEDEVMNRRIVNARLESLFMQDSNEGVDVENTEAEDETAYDTEEDNDENESLEDETDENTDRVAQFYQAFESAKEADTFGYIFQSTDAPDNLSNQTIRNSKDLVAISWASFCTGDRNNLQRDVVKIQALDTTNVLQRLQLAAAMLREEKKKWKAKLALAGITDSGNADASD